MRNVLVTGANGFVGRSLYEKLLVDGYHVHGAVRGAAQMAALPLGVEGVLVGDVGPETDWSEALSGIEVIVHLAARVHTMDDLASNSLLEFREVNTAGTLNLARQAVEAGVKRLIYLSSVKVNGEGKPDPYVEMDKPEPRGSYAVSKWEAEQGLSVIAEETGFEVVVIRSPLVYGSGVKANFRLLMKWARKGIPLPLGAVHNKRSFVALDNLVSFIIYCIDHPKAANEVFLISDAEDVSTTELLLKMRHVLGKRPFLLPISIKFMTFVAAILGKKDVADRLFSSLQVDSSKARDLLGWRPVISMDEGLRKALSHDMETKKVKQ